MGRRWFRRDPGDEAGDRPLRHALACGAYRQVMNGVAWDDWRGPGPDLADVRAGLDTAWGVRTAEDRTTTVLRLMEPEPSQGDDVFDVRRRLAAGHGPVDVESWVDALHRVAEDHGLDDGARYGLVAEARRVDAYEGLLRDHHLLGPAEQVPGLHAWDQARGVNMARDGLAAGLCDEPTARTAALRFGALVRAHHTSWTQFGVAFTLGRLLWSYDRYDELVDWGNAVGVDRTVELQRILVSDPTSPWRAVPFDG